MNYSLRTIGADGLAENTIIGRSCKYVGKLHPNFQEFKSAVGIIETDDLSGVFLHPYGHSGYTLAYEYNDYYVVQSNGETYDSYRFANFNRERDKELKQGQEVTITSKCNIL